MHWWKVSRIQTKSQCDIKFPFVANYSTFNNINTKSRAIATRSHPQISTNHKNTIDNTHHKQYRRFSSPGYYKTEFQYRCQTEALECIKYSAMSIFATHYFLIHQAHFIQYSFIVPQFMSGATLVSIICNYFAGGYQAVLILPIAVWLIFSRLFIKRDNIINRLVFYYPTRLCSLYAWLNWLIVGGFYLFIVIHYVNIRMDGNTKATFDKAKIIPNNAFAKRAVISWNENYKNNPTMAKLMPQRWKSIQLDEEGVTFDEMMQHQTGQLILLTYAYASSISRRSRRDSE